MTDQVSFNHAFETRDKTEISIEGPKAVLEPGSSRACSHIFQEKGGWGAGTATP